MSKRVAIALAVLLAAAIAALGGAGVAFADGGTGAALADDVATPLSPDDASALIAGPGTSSLSPATAVSSSTALAAASTPGAVTSYESDLTLDQAVGIDSTTAATAAATAGGSSLDTLSAPTVCWSSSGRAQWGIWPYEQKLTDTTYWCAVYGVKITYRTSSVTGGGTLCGVSWRASQLIAGGVGYPSFTMRSSVGYACPTTIPWIVLHPSHYLDVRRTDTGGATAVGSG